MDCVRERHADTWVFRKQEDEGEEEASCCSRSAKRIKILARMILYFCIAWGSGERIL